MGELHWIKSLLLGYDVPPSICISLDFIFQIRKQCFYNKYKFYSFYKVSYFKHIFSFSLQDRDLCHLKMFLMFPYVSTIVNLDICFAITNTIAMTWHEPSYILWIANKFWHSTRNWQVYIKVDVLTK